MSRLCLAAALCLAGCAGAAEVAKDKLAIAAVLDDWHDAAARADEARYFGHFAKDAVFLGTDASERWDVAAFRAYAHPHFARGRAWAFRATRREIAIGADGTAWFDEDLATEKMGPARGSGVLVKDASGEWKIAQYNLSITIPNDRFEAVKASLDAQPPQPARAP